MEGTNKWALRKFCVLGLSSFATKISTSLKSLSSTLILNLTFLIINRFSILVLLFTLPGHRLLQPQDWCIQNNEQTRRCRTEVAMAVAVVEEEHTQMGTIIIQAIILVETSRGRDYSTHF